MHKGSKNEIIINNVRYIVYSFNVGDPPIHVLINSTAYNHVDAEELHEVIFSQDFYDFVISHPDGTYTFFYDFKDGYLPMKLLFNIEVNSTQVFIFHADRGYQIIEGRGARKEIQMNL